MTLAPEQLLQARQAYLAQLRTRYEGSRSGADALQLARGEWLAGHYDPAMEHFILAAQKSPEDPEPQLSLIRAASMMGLRKLEEPALQRALARHPGSAEIALHAALRKLPDAPVEAAASLSAHREHAQVALYLLALERMSAGEAGSAPRDDPQTMAQWQSLAWSLRHADASRIHGLPVAVLESALRSRVLRDGLTMECGVYFGRSLKLIASATASDVHGFDSFQGLPEAWNANEPAGAYSTAGQLPHGMPSNVKLHAGWFEDTLPEFFATHAGPIALLHIDCDLYSSTRTVLQQSAGRIRAGSVLVFDDFLGYPGYENHELKAFMEFIADTGMGYEVLACCLMGREVAIRII